MVVLWPIIWARSGFSCGYLPPTIITPDVIDEARRLFAASVDHLDVFFAQGIENRLVPTGKVGGNESVNSKTLECNSRVSGDLRRADENFPGPGLFCQS